jgi:HSP20 family molecular chaperone IbpA
MKSNDISIETKDSNCLVISGTRKSDCGEGTEEVRVMERFFGDFKRTVCFPSYSANLESIEARVRDGLLIVEVARREGGREGERKIVIQ